MTEETEFGPDIKQMLQDVASLEREYSYEEFAGDILSIDKDGIGETFSEEGLAFNIPFTSAVNDDLCKIKLSLCDTNGTYIASETKEVSCVNGTNLVSVLFDAQTLYCSNISGPYKVQFVEVELSSGEKQRVWYAYISNEYSYKDFRSDSAVIDIDTSSVNIFAREAGSVSGYDAIVCNFNVSNSLDHAVSYTCEMILRNTNGTLVASSREVKRFEQGNNDISLYFSGDEIIESKIDGPYVISEIILKPLDEIGIKERFLPEHEAIDLTISDFITRSFYLKSIPEYKGKLEENLSINVVVERPTEITATALLIDGFGEYVTTAISTITAASIGDYTLDLSFDVAEIRASGHPGPYKISYLRLKSNIEGEKDLLIDEFEVSDIILWDYVIENGGAKICDGDSTLAMLNSTSGSLVIPSTIDGYPVTAIGDNAFSFFNNLTSVTIPDTVTSIGAEAFYGCSGITNLFIPNSVKNIGSRAFSGCSSLTTLIAGQYVCANRISNIFPDAYLTIKNIEILDGVTTIGNYAFQNCSSLTNLTIPDSVTSIGDYAFANCNNIKNLTIPDSVTNISNSAFGGCSNLTSVIIGQYVCTNQISNIFPDSYSVIENIQISDEVTRIGDDTFSGCSNLKNISLPNGLTSIGYEAFSGCEALINITIPNSVISIGGYSFSGCSGLTSISIPESVINIGRGPFSGCDGLTNIIVSSNNPNYKSVNGLLLNKDGTTLIGGINGDVIIPDGVESIGDVAFSARVNLTSITIPNSVTNIDTFAFAGCSGLTSITIPNSVTSIGNCAFSQCFGITNIIIGSCVTNIGSMAFSGCSGLTSITIPNSVKRIADRAFGNCRSLKSITIPDTVTSIEYDTFSNCISLTSIIIPNSVKSIAYGAFSNCRSLTSLTIPNGVTSIDSRTFSECSSLISITIPDSVTSIGNSAFSGCSSLTSITIPEGVTSIGDYAFRGCDSLTSITIPDSVTSIGKEIFSECSSLVSITFPDGITSIGDGAFDGCSGLTTITMPDSVTSIGNNAFSGCSGLTCIMIPDSVASIGNNAFSGCSGLTSITIPDSAKSIGENAFNLCSGLTSITIPNSVANISSNAFVCCSNLTSAVIGQYVCTNKLSQIFPDSYSTIETIEILNGVTTIGDSAFKECKGLTNITIPDSVTSIGNSAFYGCKSLTSITIPDSVTSIGDRAFYGCSDLTSVIIPEGVTSIGDWAFRDCSSLTSITIPDSVTSIGDYAFGYCSGLTSITIPDGVTTIGRSAFRGCKGLTSITIPDSVTSIGDYAFRDCCSLTSITIPDSVTSIGTYAFEGCSSLTSITIPHGVTSIKRATFRNCISLISITILDSVTRIGDYAFYGCSGLTSITIPDSVTSIGFDVFRDCRSLTNITIPDSVTSIGSGAFRDCRSLTNITIPDSVTSIGSGTYDGCSGLTSITIPNSVTSIENSAFRNCSGLTNITIGNGVTHIGNSAFEGCKGLTSVTIPDGVTSIGSGVFYYCSGLTSITIPDGVTSIGENAFNLCSGLTSITIPNSVANISSNAFVCCSNLTSAVIGQYVCTNKLSYIFPDSYSKIETIEILNGVTTIGNSAFNGCRGLTSITIPDGVTTIGRSVFGWCSGLTSITIPNSVTSIGDSAFYRCSGLTSITIPDSVTSIGRLVFDGCIGLTSITIPEGVTSIGDNAFRNCDGLTSVTIPDSVTSIGDNAFRHCGNLTEAIFLDDAPEFGMSVFGFCHEDFVVKVKKGTKGWDGDPNSTELPETWYGYPIEYATEDDWAKYLVVDLSGGANASSYPVITRFYVPSSGWTDEYKTNKLVLRRIPAGKMPRTDVDITLTKDYYVGVFEVTQKQWELVMGSNPSDFDEDTLPVECVSYDDIRGTSNGSKWPVSKGVDATSFMGKLRAKTGVNFDLPTEAQWEFSCRAGSSGDWGLLADGSISTLDAMGWYVNNSDDEMHAVGLKTPNAYGLYDMHGNVCEWCLDWYSSRGYAGTDPVGGTSGGSRVFRGGFYNDLAGGCTALDRNYYSPDNRFNSFGFRLAAPSGIFDEEAILQKNVVVYSKDGIATNYETVEAALSAVVDGDIITVLSDYTGIENNKELEFDRIGDINFTLTGSNSLSKLPVVTFNDTNEDGGKIHLTITNANLNLPEIDSRKNSVVNIYDTTMQLGNAAPGNSIVKAYFNGVVNAYTNTVLQSYIFLAMGKVNFYDNAYLDSGVARIFGNGLVTINDNAKIDIGGLELTGRAYNGRDNTDADRIGKPAEICINSGLLNVRSSAVVGATSTNGRLVIGSNGSLHLGNEGIKILAGSSLISAGNINGNINAEEGSVIEISGGVYTMDVSKWCVEGTTVIKDLHSEGYWTVLPSNKGYVKFELGDYGTQDGGGDLIQIFDKTGYNANPPIVAAKTGWVFDGWSEGYNNLSENIIIYAKYRSILPNLNVETISFDKREINSGETLTINWCVKNTGNSQFFGTMTERVWLVSSENSEIKTLLTEKPFTGVIGGCDGIVERSEKISLPKKGLEGEWLIQIETAISPSVNIYAQNKSSISNEMLVIKGVSVLTLAQALDTTNLTWKTSPDYQWLPLRAAKAFDSIDCAISGPIPDNTNSWIQTTVVGPGIISFAAMVSCEEGYDWFDFYVDGKLNGYYSGNTGWFVDSFEIGEGTHELTWVYWKDEIDENIGSYQNIAYLDSVVWTPENVSIPDYKDEEKAHTLSTEVSVPYSWLNAYPELMSEYSGDYEAAANSLAANGINKVWECYVAGLDPTDESAKFIVEIAMNGDIPIISWSPDLETRNYIIEGTETLNPPLWISPTNSTHHFFRVKVALQEEKDPVIIEKAITISFDPCGGYVSQTSLTYNHEGLLGELPTPTFEGYSFVGWFDKKAGGVEYTKISNIPASNMTLYAVWTSNAYAINFDANGGTGTMLSQTFTYGEEQTLCANTFTREGYTFAGWATTPDGEVVYTSGQNISITASMTLYAVWKANAYLVIDLSGGTSAASYPVTTLSDVPFGGWTDEYKTTKLVLRRIPAGKIPRTDVDITLTKDYYVGVFEVTQKQWELVMGSNPSNFDGDTLPVEWVTYSDIRGTSNGLKWPASNIVDETSFMGKLRAKTGIDFDLPTEAQWEYACRAGSSDDYGLLADGSIVTLDTMSWCADNSGNKTHIVGTKTPNAYGVYDMHGNVWEWCLDWYSDNGYSGTDPIGATSGSNRVLRGGSICDGICSASIRNNYNPGNRSHNLGFRLVAPAGF